MIYHEVDEHRREQVGFKSANAADLASDVAGRQAAFRSLFEALVALDKEPTKPGRRRTMREGDGDREHQRGGGRSLPDRGCP